MGANVSWDISSSEPSPSSLCIKCHSWFFLTRFGHLSLPKDLWVCVASIFSSSVFVDESVKKSLIISFEKRDCIFYCKYEN